MDEENRFWRLVVICFTVAFCFLVSTIGSCVGYQAHLVSKAVQKGVDPIQASCSIGNTTGQVCTESLLRKQ